MTRALQASFFGTSAISDRPLAVEDGPSGAKIPPTNSSFWIMKISATTLGETAGDLLSMTLGLGYAQSSLVFFGLLAVALGFQLYSKTYKPLIYWAVILLTSTAGTTMSDYMDRSMGLGYAKGTAILLAILSLIFAAWRLSGESLAVEKIRSRKVELLYWFAILFSNTLGTALGDFLADNSGLGFGGGALLIGFLLVALLLLAYFTRASKVLLFWLAFVLSRPFGATLGDVLTKDIDKGGLGFGTVRASLVLASVLFFSIAYTQFKNKPSSS